MSLSRRVTSRINAKFEYPTVGKFSDTNKRAHIMPCTRVALGQRKSEQPIHYVKAPVIRSFHDPQR